MAPRTLIAILSALLILSCSGPQDESITAPPPLPPQAAFEHLPQSGGGGGSSAGDLLVGPIPGLTTTWHHAPAVSGIPLGTAVWFRLDVPAGSRVDWMGAMRTVHAERADLRKDLRQQETAICVVGGLGEHTIRVEVTEADGYTWSRECILNALAITPAEVTVTVTPTVRPVQLGARPSNQGTMEYFFGESIADLYVVDDEQCVTSVDRTVHFTLDVVPPALLPLMEWRQEGRKPWLGTHHNHRSRSPGDLRLSVGPPQAPKLVNLETYRATITTQSVFVQDGVAVVLEVATEPPGFEEQVRWLSSTKYGSALPAQASGRTFTVLFADTWGTDAKGLPFQWLGVRADNAVFNQDQGPCLSTVSELTESIPEDFYDEIALAGGSFGQHTFSCNDMELGRLQEIRYSPVDDASDPYAFGDGADFFLEVIDGGGVIFSAWRPGAYLIKEVREFGTRITDYLWNSPPAKEKAESKKTGKKKSIAEPSADLVVISNSGSDNGYLVCARNRITGEVAIGTVANVNTAIMMAFTNNNNMKITIAIIDHGACAKQSMGDGDVTVAGGYVQRNDAVSAADLTAFIAACNGRVSACTFYGCNVADGANGKTFLQEIATGANMMVTGFSGSVYCNEGIFGFFGGWSASDNGTTITKTP